MGKYDAELDLSSRNSLYLVVQHLRPGGRVLELGPANGRLTRHLAGELGCIVDIVEMDEEAGREAAAFAEIACLGEVEGNLEAGHWQERLSGHKYDYIVCADVLEHLRKPEKVLGTCLGMLKEGGSLIASVPNLAHNAVLIGLLNDRFGYTNVGLLDNTHVHFFTRQSFREMAVQQGYAVAYEEAAYVDAPDTELGEDYARVNRSIARGLKCRENGIAYQYIFELKRKEDMEGKGEIVNLTPWSRYIIECFPQEIGQQDFTPLRHCQLSVMPRIGGLLQAEFDLRDFGALSRLRLDPLNANCALQLKYLELVYAHGSVAVNEFIMNGIRSDQWLIFADEDPQIIMDIAESEGLQSVRAAFEIIAFDAEETEEIAGMAASMAEFREKAIEKAVKEATETVMEEGSLLAMCLRRCKRFLKRLVKKNSQ